ncbi:MAG: hypothetical protein ACU0CY_07365 [Maritimibacter harenae]|nr:hypothetical protein [Maritimibacter harenae]
MSERIRAAWDRTMSFAQHKLPPGLRLVVGLFLMVFGVFGFLPIFGFWMFPLGVGIAALDIKPIWEKLRNTRRQGQ